MINGWDKTICSAFISRNNIESNVTPTVLSFLIILYSSKKAMKSHVEIFILVELVEI